MNLALYYFDSCPFCRKVLNHIDESGLKDKIIFKNTAEASNKEELMAIGGKAQVPCLIIEGKPMYESMDIIKFLKSNFEE